MEAPLTPTNTIQPSWFLCWNRNLRPIASVLWTSKLAEWPPKWTSLASFDRWPNCCRPAEDFWDIWPSSTWRSTAEIICARIPNGSTIRFYTSSSKTASVRVSGISSQSLSVNTHVSQDSIFVPTPFIPLINSLLTSIFLSVLPKMQLSFAFFLHQTARQATNNIDHSCPAQSGLSATDLGRAFAWDYTNQVCFNDSKISLRSVALKRLPYSQLNFDSTFCLPMSDYN